MATLRRSEFDRHRTFQVNNYRQLVCGDRIFQPGELFDKGLVSTRRLRQLYDNKSIVMTSEEQVAPVELVVTPPPAEVGDEVTEQPKFRTSRRR